MPNLPPGVASMLPPNPAQYMAAAGLPAAALSQFYGLQQPGVQAAAAMYGAYGANTATGLEDLAALQRASQAGLHPLVGQATAAQQAAQAAQATQKIVSV